MLETRSQGSAIKLHLSLPSHPLRKEKYEDFLSCLSLNHHYVSNEPVVCVITHSHMYLVCIYREFSSLCVVNLDNIPTLRTNVVCSRLALGFLQKTHSFPCLVRSFLFFFPRHDTRMSPWMVLTTERRWMTAAPFIIKWKLQPNVS